MERGTIWWTGKNQARPVMVVQADAFNRSEIATVIVVALTTDMELVAAPGNVLVPAKTSGLPKDAVANVAQVLTLRRDHLLEEAGRAGDQVMRAVGAGLRLSLAL